MRRITCALVLFTSLAAAQTIERLDGRTPRVDYLVVAPEAWAATLAPLLEAREERGLLPGFASLEAIDATFPGADRAARIQALVRHAAESWKRAPRFLLLAGDVHDARGRPLLPTFTVPAPTIGTCASDHPYACIDDDLVPDLAVGRFPASTEEELAGMVARTLAYEREVAVGAWRKRFSFVAGEGGFGPALDQLLENVFQQVVEQIPDAYEVQLTYKNPRSPYCYPLARFSERVVEQLNEGPLFLTYVGHGHQRSFDRDILRIADVGGVEAATAPIVVVIACSTGHYDDPEDCIGEALLKRERGPVAFIGSSRVSQPYPNGLLGLGMVSILFEDRELTLGELLMRAKGLVLADPDNPLRGQIDMMAGFFLKPEEIKEQRAEQLALYNLLGDPALLPAYPDAECSLEAPEKAAPGATIEASGKVPGRRDGAVVVRLEVPRASFVEELEPLDGADDEAVRLRNYARANDKTLVAVEAEVVDGRFEVSLTVPETAEEELVLTAWFEGADSVALGSVRLAVEE